MNHHGIIAIHEDDPSAAGAIVWWRLSGGLQLSTLAEAWANAGLDPELLPAPPSPSVALRRSMGDAKGAQSRTLVRVHPKGGFALIAESDTAEGELEYRQDLHAAIDKVGRLTVVPDDHRYAELVRGNYTAHLEMLIQADVSPWLCGLMDKFLDAVRLRDTGGVYFIPRHSMAKWQRVVDAIRNGSQHTLNAVPAMRTQDAVDAIEDAIAVEARSAVQSIETELSLGGLGVRALENRIATTTQVEEKLARYESFLGGRLAKLHDDLDALRATLTVAITKAEAQSEEEASAAQ